VMPNRNKAVIWDMDGVIADTAPYHQRAWQEVFRKRDKSYTEDNFRSNFGKRNDTIIRNILGSQVSAEEMEAITTEKEMSFRESARGNIKPLPGAIELLRSLREHGFSQALGSSAPIENIRLVTRQLGIEGFFPVIVSGKEVAEGKPSPQGFLLAAEKLGIAPQDCVVIEDATAGVTAAKRAGMHCIAVTNTSPKSKLAKADLVVDTLEKVTISNVESLLKHSRNRD
jgi:beta-phosphoglucomutase family hydrolase